MRQTVTVDKITCDWCGIEINNSCTIYIDGERTDLCDECKSRYEFISHWKENKDKLVALNMNSDVTITLGKDGAEAWNHRYDSINAKPDNFKAGDTITTQFHDFTQGMIPAFQKICCSYQGLSTDFELKMKVGNLYSIDEAIKRLF
jgi:hypothetical protein